MDVPLVELTARVPPASLLGYLNFSDGRADAKFQRALNDALGFLGQRGDPAPWESLRTWLFRQCDLLHQSQNPAFRDTTQARTVLRLAFGRVLEAYRAHHADLLSHQTDGALFTPFFLARVCEAILSQGAPWEEEERIVAGTIQKLNDFVGYRPIALLETRPQTDYYAHEKFRPVPLYLQGVGSCSGRYQGVVEKAIEVLQQTDAAILTQAGVRPQSASTNWPWIHARTITATPPTAGRITSSASGTHTKLIAMDGSVVLSCAKPCLMRLSKALIARAAMPTPPCGISNRRPCLPEPFSWPRE